MAATIIDSGIFGNIFSTDAMRQVWSDQGCTARYVEIERALAAGVLVDRVLASVAA